VHLQYRITVHYQCSEVSKKVSTSEGDISESLAGRRRHLRIYRRILRWVTSVIREVGKRNVSVSKAHLTRTCPHAHTFNGPLSGTIQVSWYQKGKTNLILLKQETVRGSGISWAIYKSAPRSRQITMPAPHRSDFYRPDGLPAAQPTASTHWRQPARTHSSTEIYHLITAVLLSTNTYFTGTIIRQTCNESSISQFMFSRLHINAFVFNNSVLSLRCFYEKAARHLAKPYSLCYF